MAKNNLTKFLTGVAVISAGVALGLAVYNKFDNIRRELEDDEFEDDEFFDDDYDEDIENTYVVINTEVVSEDDESEACDDATECNDECVEENVNEDADAPSDAE